MTDEQVKDEKWADEQFPDRGPAPTNEVVVDPDAPPSPNIEHPK